MPRAETLTSPSNPLLKDVRRAIARGGLTDQGLLVAESFHLLEEALRSNLMVRTVLAAESAQSEVSNHLRGMGSIRVAIIEDAVFQSLAATENTQGVITLAEPPSWKLDETLSGRTLAIVLDAVQDPGNAGAIVRAAEAFGATGVLFTKGSVSPFNPKTLRASAGSIFRVPFVSGVEAELIRAAIEQRQCAIYAAMPRAPKPLPDADLRRNCALVIGSEAHGVSEAWRTTAAPIAIPTQGVESLNAAVAAGVLLYEAQRQRSLA